MEPGEIIEALKAYRVTHDRIAAVIGRDRTAATKMLAGTRSIKANEIAPLTELVVQVRRESPEPPSPPDPSGPRMVNYEQPFVGPAAVSALLIRGVAQAGAWLEVDPLDQRELETYPASPDPRFWMAAQWLSRVRGDSMNALTKDGKPAGIFEGDLVHIVDAIDLNYQPVTGDVVEVERSRFSGREMELTIKQVEVAPDGAILLWPRSNNPRWQNPVPYVEQAAGAEHIEVRIRGKMIQHLRPWS